jgi:hypothetical protein
LDVFAVVQSDTSKQTMIKDYLQTSMYNFEDTGFDVSISYGTQPYFVDIDGDLRNDIIYNSAANDIKVY